MNNSIVNTQIYNITYENGKLNISQQGTNIPVSTMDNMYIVETGKKRKRDYIEINAVAPIIKKARYN